jgi:4-amino-4-deoxy-L-arabinose transferase-like glycosyltransferase
MDAHDGGPLGRAAIVERSAARRAAPITRPALVVGAVAALIRLVWVLVMSRTPQGLSDLTLYPGFANTIASGRGYLSLGEHPTAYYPPGYPYFLGGIQWLLDLVGLDDHLVVTAGLVQALLGGVAAGAVVVVGWRLTGADRRGIRVGVVAGVLVACWPNLIVHSSLMLSETLFTAVFCVLLATLVCLTDADGQVVRGRFVAAALLLGVCTLIRPQAALLLTPAIVVVWVLGGLGWRRTLQRALALVAGVLVVLTPWIIRNAVQLDAFVPLSTNTGDNLCMGFNDDASGGFMVAEDCETGEFYVDGPGAEVRRDGENRAAALSWALSNPTRLPGLSWDKLRLTYIDDRDGLRALESFGDDVFLSDGARTTLGRVMDVYFFTVLALAAVGAVLLAPRAWRERRRDSTALLLLAVTLAGVVVPIASFADTRFKVPVAPCFALLAAVTVGAALQRWRRREPEQEMV